LAYLLLTWAVRPQPALSGHGQRSNVIDADRMRRSLCNVGPTATSRNETGTAATSLDFRLLRHAAVGRLLQPAEPDYRDYRTIIDYQNHNPISITGGEEEHRPVVNTWKRY
jgi:hypothetical protein